MTSRSRLVRWIQSWSLRTELFVVLTIAFGYSVLGSLLHIGGGMPPLNADALLYGIVAQQVVLGSICLALLWARGKRVRDYGMQPSFRQGLTGVGLFASQHAIWIGIQVIWYVFNSRYWVEPSEPPPSIEFDAHMITAMCLVVVINSLYEELFVTGYLMSSLCDMGRPVLAVVASVALRTAYHLYQGPTGWVSIAALGFLFSVYYADRKYKGARLTPPA